MWQIPDTMLNVEKFQFFRENLKFKMFKAQPFDYSENL